MIGGMMMCDKIHWCHCGTSKSEKSPHKTGENGCIRRITLPPVYVECDKWEVDGYVITDHSLRQQRGYHQHECGCWTWWCDSTNSIDA